MIKANAKVSVEKIFLVVFWFCSSRPANNLLCGVMDASKYENPSDEKFLNFQEKKIFRVCPSKEIISSYIECVT